MSHLLPKIKPSGLGESIIKGISGFGYELRTLVPLGLSIGVQAVGDEVEFDVIGFDNGTTIMWCPVADGPIEVVVNGVERGGWLLDGNIIGSGESNSISGGENSCIIGGKNNTIVSAVSEGYNICLAGENLNIDGSHSAVGGKDVTINGDNTFCWGGSSATIAEDNFFCIWPVEEGSVAIGTNSKESSALLELSSTSKGLLLPRMSESQRDSIPSPAEALVIYNTDEMKAQLWDGTDWKDFN